MKISQFLFLVLSVGLIFSSCSTSDDDIDGGFGGDTYFRWNTPTLPYTAAVTATYSGEALSASAEGHQDGIKIRIVARFDSEGSYVLDKNDSDPDDNYLMEYNYNNNLYITTTTHSVDLEIVTLNESQKEILGRFSGEVVNKDNASDIITLSNGEFLIRYF